MDNEYLLNFLKEKNVPIIQKKRHTYLAYYGLEQQDTYVLKEGDAVKRFLLIFIPYRNHSTDCLQEEELPNLSVLWTPDE